VTGRLTNASPGSTNPGAKIDFGWQSAFGP
jgi:hypothetical protein